MRQERFVYTGLMSTAPGTFGALQVYDDAGAPVDAHFEMERVGSQLCILFHSRGGTKGSGSETNTQYALGLEILLRRLSDMGIAICDGFVASQATAHLSEQQRRVEEEGLRYPVIASDAHETRKAFSRGMARVGRPAGAKGGGNQTRRIRLLLEAESERCRELEQKLAGPPRGSHQSRSCHDVSLSADEVPQADRIDRVLALVVAASSTDQHDEHEPQLSDLDYRYYISAGRILGFLDDAGEVTAVGEALSEYRGEQRYARGAQAFAESRIGRCWRDWAGAEHLAEVDPATAAPFLLEMSDLADATARQGATALRLWATHLARHFGPSVAMWTGPPQSCGDAAPAEQPVIDGRSRNGTGRSAGPSGFPSPVAELRDRVLPYGFDDKHGPAHGQRDQGRRAPTTRVPGLPSNARALFTELVLAEPIGLEVLRSQVEQYLRAFEAESVTNDYADLAAAEDLAAASHVLIDAMDGMKPTDRAIAQAAIRYYAIIDDGDSDYDEDGLRDDAGVMDAVMCYLGFNSSGSTSP